MNPTLTDEKFEYLVTYSDPGPHLFVSRRGRSIKQTREAADKLMKWARSKGYRTIKLRVRLVSEWHDIDR